MAGKKSSSSNYEQRRVRTQQIIFGVIAVIIIFTWVIGLIAK
jgi:predicted nucleic acid-binding Zn ribbon protein